MSKKGNTFHIHFQMTITIFYYYGLNLKLFPSEKLIINTHLKYEEQGYTFKKVLKQSKRSSIMIEQNKNKIYIISSEKIAGS